MIYLTGVTFAERGGSRKKTKKFKRLKIPFESEKEIEAFRADRSNVFDKEVYFMSIEKQML